LAFQHTLSQTVEIEGIGLHTGESGRLRLRPAEAGEGVVFLSNGRRIPARAEFVVSTQRATVLEKDGARISTIEHLLAALNGLGIDNALLEVEGPEIPALDGSAAAFVEKIRGTGIRRLAKAASLWRISAPLWVVDKESLLLALPSRSLRLTYMGDFPGLGFRKKSLRLEPGVFAREIAPARTFAARQEVEGLLAQGLGRGASRETVVILGEEGPSLPLRFADEPLRHKLLDLLGDLALLGGRLQAHIIAIRSGHRLNVELVRKIVERSALTVQRGMSSA